MKRKEYVCPRCREAAHFGDPACSYCGNLFSWQSVAQPTSSELFSDHADSSFGEERPRHTRYVAFLVFVLIVALGMGGFSLFKLGVFSSFVATSSNQSPVLAPVPTLPELSTTAPPQTDSQPARSVKPAPVLHNSDLNEIQSNPIYWNIAWQDRIAELQAAAIRINQLYLKTHTYIKNETDCNDMAVEIWNMLQTEGIASIIVVGNLELDKYTFAQCNHAWLHVFTMARGETIPKSFVLETTNGSAYFRQDAERDQKLNRYWGGFWYVKPSYLRADFKDNW